MSKFSISNRLDNKIDSINKINKKYNKIQSSCSENSINDDSKLSVVYKGENNIMVLNENINNEKGNKSQSQRNSNFSNSIQEINQIAEKNRESNYSFGISSINNVSSIINNNSNSEENKNDNDANISSNSNINQNNNNFDSSKPQNSDSVNDNENENKNKKTYPTKFNIDDENKIRYREGSVLGSNLSEEDNEEVKKLKYKVRIDFVKKVYALVTLQLIITLLINCLSFKEEIKNYFHNNYLLLSVGIFTMISVLIFLNCKKNISNEVPNNYFLLLLFILSISIILLFLSAAFSTEKIIIIWASLIVMSNTIILISFCLKDRFDLTFGLIIIVLMAIIFLIVLAVFSKVLFEDSIEILFSIITALGSVFFGIYLMFHTQLLLTKKIEVDTDRYIITSMQIYSDIVLIFINLVFTLSNKFQ